MHEPRVVVDMEIGQPLVAFQLELAGIDETMPGARTPRVLYVNDVVDLGLDARLRSRWPMAADKLDDGS